MPQEVLNEILQWSAGRPAWQRDALRRIFTGVPFASAEVDELVELCKSAHGLAEPRTANVLDARHLATTDATAPEAVSLVSVTHHRGVNALAVNQSITFGPNLTLVYGQNAAGKSGYTRILKLACRSRSAERVLGNVLGGTAPIKPQATITFREGTVETPLTWTPDAAPADALATVSVFDSHCAPIYLRDKTDVAFRPFGLDAFDKLSSVCADVRRRLEAEQTALATGAALLPNLPDGTRAKTAIANLTSLTKPTDIEAIATLSDTEAQLLKGLQERRRDQQAADPKGRAKELTARAQRIDSVATHVASLATLYGAERFKALQESADALRTAKQALELVRKNILAPGLLPGTGEEVWRAMWRAAGAFLRVAEAGSAKEMSDATHCPLCQQSIEPDAASRLKHFQEYVASSAQADVDTAQATYAGHVRALSSAVINREDITLAIAELRADDVPLADGVTSFLSGIAAAQSQVGALTEPGQMISTPALPSSPEEALRSSSKALRTRATQLGSESVSMDSKDASSLVDLEARVVLKEHLPAVLNEIERKKKIAAYGQCLDDTRTQAVTAKSTELTKRLVTDQLRNAFQEELQKLDFTHLAVEIAPAGGAKGALLHHLRFTNGPGVTVTDVLSEGESRTLSLAAFLTELSTGANRSAIIFDDPVSSLDHIWRERIAHRLVEESKVRQVIVFTHDLLFLRSLIEGAGRNDVAFVNQYVRRYHDEPGVCSADLPWVAMGVKDRIKVLNSRWQAADALFRTSKEDEYEKEAREIYGALRETWEQAVGEVLLADVVARYRHDVQTMKVRYLHDITEEECKAVDDGMTECSRWMRGHDQPPADGTPFPKPADLKKGVEAIDNWAKTIRKRRS